MRISELLLRGQRQLKSDSAHLDAEILLAHLLDRDRAWVLAHATEHVDQTVIKHFLHLIKLRAQGFPVPYITGLVETPVGKMSVDPRVLIPRASTELLLQAILPRIQSHPSTVADIGTGSGVIAISLAKALPEHQVEASDISPSALEVARANAATHGVADRIIWRFGSLLQPWMSIVEPRVIVANLPYVPLDAMQNPALQHEPRLALYGGTDGLGLLKQLAHQLSYHPLVEVVALECQPDQVDTVAYWLRQVRPTPFRITPIVDGPVAWGVIAERY